MSSQPFDETRHPRDLAGKFTEKPLGNPGQLAFDTTPQPLTTAERAQIRELARRELAELEEDAERVRREVTTGLGPYPPLHELTEKMSAAAVARDRLTTATIDEALATIRDRHPNVERVHVVFSAKEGRPRWQISGPGWEHPHDELDPTLRDTLEGMEPDLGGGRSDGWVPRAKHRDGASDTWNVDRGVGIDPYGRVTHVELDPNPNFPSAMSIVNVDEPDRAEFDGYGDGCPACGVAGGHSVSCPRRLSA